MALDIFIFFIGFIFGWVLNDLFTNSRKKFVEIDKPEIEFGGVADNHLPPIYYGYNGGFANVNKCSNCGLIGLYEDLHESSPCPVCGAKVHRYGSAKWVKVNGFLKWAKSKVN